MRARLGRFGSGFGPALGAIAAVGLAVRVVYVVVVEPRVPFVSDPTSYHLLANHLADGHGYVRPFDLLQGRSVPTAEFPPLLPAFLSVVAWFGGTGVTAQRLATTSLGAATVVLVGLLGRRVAGPRAGLIAAGIAAVHPMLVQPDGTLTAESPFVLLVVAALVLTYRVVDGGGLRSWAALGAVVGLAGLTRGEGLLLLPLLVVPAAWRGRRWRAAGVALAACAVVVLPWTVRNWVVLDAVVPVSTNAGGLLAGANCDAVYGSEQQGLWLLSCAHSVDARGVDEVERARRQARAGLSYLEDHAGELPRMAAVRWLRTWGLFRPGQQIDVAVLEGRTRAWETAGVVLDYVLVAGAVAGVVVLRRRGAGPVWPLLAMGVLVSVLAVGAYGNLRFRVAAEPALAVLAAAAVAGRQERAS